MDEDEIMEDDGEIIDDVDGEELPPTLGVNVGDTAAPTDKFGG